MRSSTQLPLHLRNVIPLPVFRSISISQNDICICSNGLQDSLQNTMLFGWAITRLFDRRPFARRWVQERGYAIKDNNQQFEPTTMGEALIGAYDRMGLKAVYECAPGCSSSVLQTRVSIVHASPEPIQDSVCMTVHKSWMARVLMLYPTAYRFNILCEFELCLAVQRPGGSLSSS